MQRNDRRRPQANLKQLDDPTLGQYGIDSLQLFVSQLNTTHALVSTKADTSEWLLDSGATHHMTTNREWLKGYKPLTKPIRVFLDRKSVV